MRLTFHTLLIWLMLLAVPVQGYAVASMLSCESTIVSSALPADVHSDIHAHHHDHAQMSADVDHAHHHQHDSNHHAADKCGACAACCIGASMTAPAALILPHLHINSEPITALDAFPSSTVPDHPDRPPQASLV